MPLEQHQRGWVIIASFGFAALLTIIPLPSWAIFWRPDFLALTLIYWCIALPQRVGVFSGWLVGFLKDVLLASLLGLYALSLTFIAFVSISAYRRLRAFPYHQQMFLVFIMLLAVQLPSLWMRGLQTNSLFDFSFMYSALSSTLIWPLVSRVLRHVQHTFQVR